MRRKSILGASACFALTLAAVGIVSAARADDALDRCWRVIGGMTREEASHVLDQPVQPGFNGLISPGKVLPCFLRVSGNRVSEIQINEHQFSPPHEALFAEELKRRIAMWGRPDMVSFVKDQGKFFASWGDGTKNVEMFSIEPEAPDRISTGSKNGALLHDYIANY